MLPDYLRRGEDVALQHRNGPLMLSLSGQPGPCGQVARIPRDAEEDALTANPSRIDVLKAPRFTASRGGWGSCGHSSSPCGRTSRGAGGRRARPWPPTIRRSLRIIVSNCCPSTCQKQCFNHGLLVLAVGQVVKRADRLADSARSGPRKRSC
jgi:hypothetical protein